MIKKIIHIADVHIPNTEEARPYSEMLKGMLADILKETKGFNKEEVRIVIVGDVYHNKNKNSNEAHDMFHTMLNYLNAIAKTYIVAGNHDMLENNTQRVDSITPTFSIKDVYPNIIYLDKVLDYKSGCLVDDDIIFALYSMHEGFMPPNIEEAKKENPNCKVVGLYHGDIPGATTDIGRVSENGINVKDFKGCDCVMAGHIHKYQVIKKGGVSIVYPSSVFQQNVGENTTGHGFVVWNMETLKHKLHEVNNDYRIYKFKIGSYDDVKADTERLINL